MPNLQLTLSFTGSDADDHELDFYDAAVALMGFQRSLALTAHYVLNDEVITQAPSLKGVRLLVEPPQAGSWKIKTSVEPQQPSATTSASYGQPTAEAINSTYDYVVARTLGLPTDFEGDVATALDSVRRSDSPRPSQKRLDAVVEKCEVAIRDMHRPIIASRSADSAKIKSSIRPRSSFDYSLSPQTYQHILEGLPDLNPREFFGKVSSYNVNTFKGRIFIATELRPVAFELRQSTRTPRTIAAITASLAANAGSRDDEAGMLRFLAVPYETRTGRLRSLEIVAADHSSLA